MCCASAYLVETSETRFNWLGSRRGTSSSMTILPFMLPVYTHASFSMYNAQRLPTRKYECTRCYTPACLFFRMFAFLHVLCSSQRNVAEDIFCKKKKKTPGKVCMYTSYMHTQVLKIWTQAQHMCLSVSVYVCGDKIHMHVAQVWLLASARIFV